MDRFKKLLCVLDSRKCEPALERAVSLAENNQADLTVVSVVSRVTAGIGMPEGGPISAQLQDAVVAEKREQLNMWVEPYGKRSKIETNILVGTPFLEVTREVLRNERDLVIKMPEQQDWLDRLFGSNDMHLLRKCPCPVWLIKPQAPKAFRHVLAAVDFDADASETNRAQRAMNRQILEMASSVALADFSALHIVHAWDAVGVNVMRGAFAQLSEEEIERYVEDVRRQHMEGLDALLREAGDGRAKDALAYLKPHKHLVRGAARKEIPVLARKIDADLLVMGTVVRTGIPGLFIGNTAETILNQISCSVLAIKPPGFVTPVTPD